MNSTVRTSCKSSECTCCMLKTVQNFFHSLHEVQLKIKKRSRRRTWPFPKSRTESAVQTEQQTKVTQTCSAIPFPKRGETILYSFLRKPYSKMENNEFFGGNELSRREKITTLYRAGHTPRQIMDITGYKKTQVSETDHQ